MGYTLQIGEACICGDDEHVRIGVIDERHELAPAYGDATDGTNTRCSSRAGWTEAMKTLGIDHVMFGQAEHGWIAHPELWPLMQDRCDAIGITAEHVEEIGRALSEYRRKHPTHRAEYPPVRDEAEPVIEGTLFFRDEDYLTDPEFDSALCSGEWLEYWLKWAIKSCENPVFVNI